MKTNKQHPWVRLQDYYMPMPVRDQPWSSMTRSSPQVDNAKLGPWKCAVCSTSHWNGRCKSCRVCGEARQQPTTGWNNSEAVERLKHKQKGPKIPASQRPAQPPEFLAKLYREMLTPSDQRDKDGDETMDDMATKTEVKEETTEPERITRLRNHAKTLREEGEEELAKQIEARIPKSPPEPKDDDVARRKFYTQAATFAETAKFKVAAAAKEVESIKQRLAEAEKVMAERTSESEAAEKLRLH